VHADELEHTGRDRATRRLRREISRHEPGSKSGTGKRGGEDGCDDELPQLGLARDADFSAREPCSGARRK
jgi:hypothetical protein